MAMYLAKELTGASVAEIGQVLGGKHHTTVMNSIARIQSLREADGSVDREIVALQEHIVCPDSTGKASEPGAANTAGPSESAFSWLTLLIIDQDIEAKRRAYHADVAEPIALATHDHS